MAITLGQTFSNAGNSGGPGTVAGVTTSGANKIGLVMVGSDRSSITCSAVTWGASSMTRLKVETISGHETSLWYLINPPSASSTVSATLSGFASWFVGVCSFNGVYINGPISASVSGNGTSSAPSINITTVNKNDVVVGACGKITTGTETLNIGATYTLIASGGIGNQPNFFEYKGPIASPGVVAIDFTSNASTGYMIMGLSLRPFIPSVGSPMLFGGGMTLA